MNKELEKLISEILETENQQGSADFGLHRRYESFPKFLGALYEWSRCLNRDTDELIRGIEPSLRQSVLMSLIPARALAPDFQDTFDSAIHEHLGQIGVTLSSKSRKLLRQLIINLRKLSGVSSEEARRKSFSIADLKGRGKYDALRDSQCDRCKWCGVELDSENVSEVLDHILPKHMGSDPDDGTNWALSCSTCNQGKSDSISWSTTAHAYDYISRQDTADPFRISPNFRWVILRRSGHCDCCGKPPKLSELAIHLRVPTGLPIPANCTSRCTDCAKTVNGSRIVQVRWGPKELGRGLTSIYTGT